MKLTYIEEGSADCPLLMLSHFTEAEVSSLLQMVRDLVSGKTNTCELHSLPSTLPGQSVRLTLVSSKNSIGVTGSMTDFTCELTPSKWDTVEGLIEPFTELTIAGYFQWLDETSNIGLLISTDGQW